VYDITYTSKIDSVILHEEPRGGLLIIVQDKTRYYGPCTGHRLDFSSFQ